MNLRNLRIYSYSFLTIPLLLCALAGCDQGVSSALPSSTSSGMEEEDAPSQEYLDAAKQLVEQGRAARDRGDLQAAYDIFEQAVDQYPQFAPSLIDLGNMEWKHSPNGIDSYYRAAELYTQAIVLLEPKADFIHHARGRLYEQIANHTDDDTYRRLAIADYTKVINAKPDPCLMLNRAILYSRLGQTEQANEDNQAIVALLTKVPLEELQPGERQILAYAYLNNVDLLVHLKRYDEAVQWGNNAVLVGRGIPNAHLQQAHAYYSRASHLIHSAEDYEAAAAASRDTISYLPNWDRAWLKYGQSMSQLGHWNTAAQSLTIALNLSGKRDLYGDDLRDAWEKLGDYENLMATREWYSNSESNDPNQLWLEANYLAGARKFEEAQQLLSKAIEREPGKIGPRRALAKVYASQGNHEAYHRTMEEEYNLVQAALAENPHSEVALADLTLVLIEWNNEQHDVARQELYRNHSDSHMVLNSLAWYYAIRENLTPPQRELMQQAAAQLEQGEPAPMELDTLAAVAAATGDFEQAAQWQASIVNKVPNRDRYRFLKRLSLYRNGRPYLESDKELMGVKEPISIDQQFLATKDFAAVHAATAETSTFEADDTHGVEATVVIESKYGPDIAGVPFTGHSTGVILDPSGYVLTSSHALPHKGSVTLEYWIQGSAARLARKRAAYAEVIALDPVAGLALLKFEPQGEVAHVNLANQVNFNGGEALVAIGARPPSTPNRSGSGSLAGNVLSSLGSAMAQLADPIEKLHFEVDTPLAHSETRPVVLVNKPMASSYCGAGIFNEAGQLVGIAGTTRHTLQGDMIRLEEVRTFLGLN